jgi:hypothetical protein
MPDTQLSFFAESVEAGTTEFTPSFVVSFLAFGTGDPEAEGHSWNFSRSTEDDDGEVCTVREIQQATIYGGIESFRLHRAGLECDFEARAAEDTGYRRLSIRFSIDERAWKDVVETARIVFRDCSYFVLLEKPPN